MSKEKKKDKRNFLIKFILTVAGSCRLMDHIFSPVDSRNVSLVPSHLLMNTLCSHSVGNYLFIYFLKCELCLIPKKIHLLYFTTLTDRDDFCYLLRYSPKVFRFKQCLFKSRYKYKQQNVFLVSSSSLKMLIS